MSDQKVEEFRRVADAHRALRKLEDAIARLGELLLVRARELRDEISAASAEADKGGEG